MDIYIERERPSCIPRWRRSSLPAPRGCEVQARSEKQTEAEAEAEAVAVAVAAAAAAAESAPSPQREVEALGVLCRSC